MPKGETGRYCYHMSVDMWCVYETELSMYVCVHVFVCICTCVILYVEVGG